MKTPLCLWKTLCFLTMVSLLSCGPSTSHQPRSESSNLHAVSDSTYTLKLTQTPDQQYRFETCFTGTSKCVAAFQTASDKPITMSKKETEEFHESQLYTLRGLVKSQGGQLIGSAFGAGGSGALVSGGINYAEENLPNVKKLNDIQTTLLRELDEQGIATVGEAKEILAKRQEFLRQNKLTLSSKQTDPTLLGILLDPNLQSQDQIEQARDALIKHNNHLRLSGVDMSGEVPNADSLMAIKKADPHVFDNKFIRDFGRSAINELRSAHIKLLPALQSPEAFAKALSHQGLDYDTILSQSHYHRAEEMLKPMYRPSYSRYVNLQRTLASWQGWKELPVSTDPSSPLADLQNINEYVKNKGIPPVFDKIVETNALNNKLIRAFPSPKAAQTLTSPSAVKLGARLLKSPAGQLVMIIAASAAGFFGTRSIFDRLGNQNVILQYPSLMEPQAEEFSPVKSAEDVLQRLAKLLASSGYKVDQYCLPDGCLSVN